MTRHPTGRIVDEPRQYTSSAKDIARAEARREIERRRDALQTEREHDLSYYLFEGDA